MKARLHNCILLLMAFLVSLGGCDNNGIPEADVEEVPDTIGLMARDTGVTQRDSLVSAMHRMNRARFGDFDSLFKRRLIRVLIPYSRTLFFNDKGQERGISAEVFRDFEFYLNKKYKRKLRNIPLTVIFVPTPRDQLLKRLNEGFGDIAAGNLTVTKGRLEQVDFFTSDKEQELFEIPLTRRNEDSLTSPFQLSGRTVHVRKSSSYYEHLKQLNGQLMAMGKPPVNLVPVSENLEDEDLMEMLDAGILSTLVVNRWKSRMWAVLLPNIRLNERAAVHSGGYVGWAMRKNSPKLLKELHTFYFKYEKPNGVIPYRLKKYAATVKHLQDPTQSGNSERYKHIVRLFKKYGKQYDFDPLLLTALGFQESKLDQNKRSRVGAVGVMQLMPATGASMQVGNIYVTEPNIHAGAKYMSIIMTKYFKDARFNAFNRSLFAFASYNAGPARISGLRRIAASRGLNPDVWLNNVEIIASEKIGQETTTYVRNIMKYYYSYKLMQEQHEVKKIQLASF